LRAVVLEEERGEDPISAKSAAGRLSGVWLSGSTAGGWEEGLSGDFFSLEIFSSEPRRQSQLGMGKFEGQWTFCVRRGTVGKFLNGTICVKWRSLVTLFDQMLKRGKAEWGKVKWGDGKRMREPMEKGKGTKNGILNCRLESGDTTR
jgi:hypothetical protein